MRGPPFAALVSALVLPISAVGPATPRERPTIVLEGHVFELHGLCQESALELRNAPRTDPRWAEILSVRVDDGRRASLPMAGRYRLRGATVELEPLFPLAEGVRYVAWGKSCGEAVEATFDVPRAPVETTRVTRVYPSSSTVPENLLRFYVYFSSPMSEGDALEHLSLLDESGREVRGVFFDNFYELWDPTRRRLTLLLDPGRVKTGLVAHEALGRALSKGCRYRLVIDRSWKDASGNTLESGFEKPFVAAGEDLVSPDPEDWSISTPEAGTREPLVLRFPESLDHALLAAFVRVHSEDGAAVRGVVDLDEEETVWRYTPRDAWKPGRYTLDVDTRLEDLAGNNLERPFEAESNAPALSASSLSVPFRIEKGGTP